MQKTEIQKNADEMLAIDFIAMWIKRLAAVALVILIVLVLLTWKHANAQEPAATLAIHLVDHWTTSAECLVASRDAPYYYPTILHSQKLRADEVVYGIPTGGCVEMDLPDRIGKHGWVQVAADRPFVYDKKTGKILRMKECNNKAYAFVPFEPIKPVNGKDGVQGLPGPPGRDGRDSIDGKDGQPGHDGRNGTSYVPPPPLAERSGKSHGKLIAVLVAVGAAAAVGIVVGTRHKNQPPVVATLPPTGSGLPVVTTLPPGGGH